MLGLGDDERQTSSGTLAFGTRRLFSTYSRVSAGE